MLAYAAYDEPLIHERHPCRYEFNSDFAEVLFPQQPARWASIPRAIWVEIVELTDHPWFVRRAVPSGVPLRPMRPHPLFRDSRGRSAQLQKAPRGFYAKRSSCWTSGGPVQPADCTPCTRMRRIRQKSIHVQIRPSTRLRTISPMGVILTGGPQGGVYDPNAKQVRTGVLRPVSVLGICYGQQWLVHTLPADRWAPCRRSGIRRHAKHFDAHPLFARLA